MAQADPLQTVRAFSSVLEHLGIAYAVGGSMASSVYGIPRATNPVDFVLDLGAEKVAHLVSALEADFYIDAEMVEQAISHHASFNAVHRQTFDKVDAFIAKPGPVNRQQLSRRRRITLGTPPFKFSIDVASPEDIILAKLDWYEKSNRVSDRQWADVVGVIRVQGAALDMDYLRQWAAKTGQSELLEQALRDGQVAGGSPD